MACGGARARAHSRDSRIRDLLLRLSCQAALPSGAPAGRLGTRPRPGALASLLRLKGIAWHGDVPNQQVQMALAGTEFTISPGPPWWSADASNSWPSGLEEQFVEDICQRQREIAGGSWDAMYGDRCTELVCIGRELDHEAARAQLEECLLTADEMLSTGLVRVMDEQSVKVMDEHNGGNAMGGDACGDGGCGVPDPAATKPAVTDPAMTNPAGRSCRS